LTLSQHNYILTTTTTTTTRFDVIVCPLSATQQVSCCSRSSVEHFSVSRHCRPLSQHLLLSS